MRIFILFVLLIPLLIDLEQGHTQDSFANDPALLAWKQIQPVARCGRCHASSEPNPLFGSDFVRLVELREWLFLDKHAIARRLIEPLAADELAGYRDRLETELGVDRVPDDWLGASNTLSHQIVQQLGWDVSTEAGYAPFRDRCLTCHGGYDGSDQHAALFGLSGNQQPGIACTHCHGSGDEPWVDEHEDPSWRTLTAAAKAEQGNLPIADPVLQAKTCLECHVGNIGNGRFVTHDMYAAGHPPLPGIELETFCESLQQPRENVPIRGEILPHHWRPLETLPHFEDRAAYLEATFPHLYAGEQKPDFESVGWNTRKVVVGALVTKQQQLRQLATATETEHWGDYALYDCAACHHPLYWPSPRQRRGYRSRYDAAAARPPGRPRLPEWPDVVLNAFLQSVDASNVDREATLALENAIDAKPFGDPTRVRAAATDAAEALDVAIAKALALPFNAEQSERVLDAILQHAIDSEGRLLEFNAARQVVWFIRQLGSEIERLDPGRLPPDFTARLAALQDVIPLQLPAGRNQRISRDLESTLIQQGAYQPARLEAALRELASSR